MKQAETPDKSVKYFFDGEPGYAVAGQNVAAAILQNGVRVLRTTRVSHAPRGIFCGIGICFDCLVVIDGIPNQRACLIEVCDGMRIESQVESGFLEVDQ
ncbi:MAG: (2Fe-2S)-binding protein [Candidatus Nanopelagicaceae bacterium]|nr:(2Fe-2S)-binding protein [Candidatus Nanopelagicaceae bacterium]